MEDFFLIEAFQHIERHSKRTFDLWDLKFKMCNGAVSGTRLCGSNLPQMQPNPPGIFEAWSSSEALFQAEVR